MSMCEPAIPVSAINNNLGVELFITKDQFMDLLFESPLSRPTTITSITNGSVNI